MRWAIRNIKKQYRAPEHEYWANLISVYNETKWSYPILAATPPGWLAQFSIAVDELRKWENVQDKRRRRAAKGG